jgi:hypothetical protein
MKTALEWLEDTLYPYLNKEDKEYTDVLFNKAKEMEKEQIIKAYENTNSMAMYGEQYYNETFNTKER